MLSFAAGYLAVFGVLTFAGGVVGFVKAKSVASLIAGGIAGALLFVACALTFRAGTNQGAGLLLGLVVSAALAARFGMAFRKTKKVMPAGLMALLGSAGVVVTASAFLMGA